LGPETVHAGDESGIERACGLATEPVELALVDQAPGELHPRLGYGLIVRFGEDTAELPGGLGAALLHRLFQLLRARLARLVQCVLDIGLHLFGRTPVEP